MFVFFDTYQSVAHEDSTGRLASDVPARLGITFSRAISAMLVTSVSTAASFFANVVSTLPVIKEFGIFMGLVIVVNFITIVIYFPALVVIADEMCCGKSEMPRPSMTTRPSFDPEAVPPNLTRGGADYTRESFALEKDDGWSAIHIFFYSKWAPMIRCLRIPIVVLTLAGVVAAGIFSAMNVVPADQQPSFFPPDHNNGMLEIINRDYVAGTTLKLEEVDSQVWGGGGGGGSGGDTPTYCPVVSGMPCSGHGSCNPVFGACICFTDYEGVDCSTSTSGGTTTGKITIGKSRGRWRDLQASSFSSSISFDVTDFTSAVQTETLVLSNTGQTQLNWYFIEGQESKFNPTLSEDSETLPTWLALSAYYGSVDGGASQSVTLTFTPNLMSCIADDTCIDNYSFVFSQTGVDSETDVLIVTRLSHLPVPSATLSPTTSPTPSPPPASCANGVKDNTETDVDCGGDACLGCEVDERCGTDSDCLSGACDGAPSICVVAPTPSPTNAPTFASDTCNQATCNDHGMCEDNVCACYPGFDGPTCAIQLTAEKSTHVTMDVYWGVLGIDRSQVNANLVSGTPIFDADFELTPEAQLFLKDICDVFRAANQTLMTFPLGTDWFCMWEVLDAWLIDGGGSGLPLESEEALVEKLIGTDGFFSTYYVTIAGERIGVNSYHEYIGLDKVNRRVTWVRLGLDTEIDKMMDATKGEELYKTWNEFLKNEVDTATPESMGRAVVTNFLWVRIMTELSLIRSTVMAWVISNASAFCVILMFTRSLYLASLATFCILSIVVCLLWFMICLMGWPLGAMEALSVTIFVGLACDYCLHLAHAFKHSTACSGKLRVRQALTVVGNSILGAAITTAGSCLFLLFCVIVFFKKMGLVIIFNTLGSVYFALVFFPAVLSTGRGSFKKGEHESMEQAIVLVEENAGGGELEDEQDEDRREEQREEQRTQPEPEPEPEDDDGLLIDVEARRSEDNDVFVRGIEMRAASRLSSGRESGAGNE
jgi:hypothetical protein